MWITVRHEISRMLTLTKSILLFITDRPIVVYKYSQPIQKQSFDSVLVVECL